MTINVQRVLVTPDGKIMGAGEFPLSVLPATFLLDGSGATISTPQIIPLQATAAQVLNVTLNQQSCTIHLAFKDLQIPAAAEIVTDPPPFEPANPGFLDLYVNGVLIIGGVLCQSNNLIVRNAYLGFIGDLAFVDTQPPVGVLGEDPLPSGLGSRWALTYWPDLE